MKAPVFVKGVALPYTFAAFGRDFSSGPGRRQPAGVPAREACWVPVSTLRWVGMAQGKVDEAEGSVSEAAVGTRPASGYLPRRLDPWNIVTRAGGGRQRA